MAKCNSRSKKQAEKNRSCETRPTCTDKRAAQNGAGNAPLEWFGKMIQNCYQYAADAKAGGKRIVGIMCEYTPRELIMAADAVPVCLCGGSAEMVASAEEDLPANLCPLIKSTYGYHIRKANPFLEMADLIVAETTCDGKKKMYELMAQTRPTYVLELPQKPDDADAMRHWRAELRKFRAYLEDLFGIEITDEKIIQAVGVMNRERFLRRQVAELMKSDRPPLTGRQLLEFKSSISGLCADFEQYSKALELYKSGYPQSPSNGRVRVMMTGVPTVHGAEKVVDIVESSGGLVVCMDNCTGIKPILEDVDETAGDLIQALAEMYFHLPCSVMTRNDRRFEVLRQLAVQYRPQCIVELIWQACLTYDVESYFVKRLAEQELAIPYLKIETDYSPSDSERIRLRVEALFETVRQQAASNV
jgi:benzoyl-CoA reductase/2-hydroxyglutaryl-CoA dehydratase subunit BcrC/BadD/HgdB